MVKEGLQKALSLLVVPYKSFTKSSEVCGNCSQPMKDKALRCSILRRSDLINRASMWSQLFTLHEHIGCPWTHGAEGARHRFLGGENVS